MTRRWPVKEDEEKTRKNPAQAGLAPIENLCVTG